MGFTAEQRAKGIRTRLLNRADSESPKKPAILRPLKAMRAKCLDCSCGSSNEVKLCPLFDCPLYPYRFGRRPQKEGVSG